MFFLFSTINFGIHLVLFCAYMNAVLIPWTFAMTSTKLFCSE